MNTRLCVLLLGFLFLTAALPAQTTTWQGIVNTNWFTAGNWTNGVPNTNTDAIIAPGNRICIVAQQTGFAKSLTIQNGATLIIQSGSPALTVANDAGPGIRVEAGGTLNIPGTINVNGVGASSTEGLLNLGTTIITGALVINGVNTDGVYNVAGAVLSLEGNLDIGLTTGVGGDGIENYGTISQFSGTINIRNTDDSGIKNLNALNYNGTINIGTNGSNRNIDGIGIDNSATFDGSGTLNIQHTASISLLNSSSMTLDGTVTLANAGLSGLRTDAGTTVQLSDGINLTISNTGQHGIQNLGGTIECLGTSTITINDTGADGINTTSGSTTELFGKVSIGVSSSIGQQAIENRGTFIYGGSGDCTDRMTIGDGALRDLVDAMVNNGTIIYESTDNGSLGTNNGTVISKLGATITIANDNGFYSTEADNLWIACTDTDWHTPSNWSDGAVPDAADKAVILAATGVEPVLNSDATCGSLVLETGTSLSIGSSITLAVVGDNLSVDNSGTITNDGTFIITKSTDTEMAFANHGTLTNRGSIQITHGSKGIYAPAGSTLDNKAAGEITITDCTIGLESNTTINNLGVLRIAGGETGVHTTARFINEEDATVTIDGTSTVAFYQDSDISSGNVGYFLIGQTTPNLGIGLVNTDAGGHFVTSPTIGEMRITGGTKGMVIGTELLHGNLITIDGTSDTPLEVLPDAFVDCYGDIQIGQNSPVGGPVLIHGRYRNTSGSPSGLLLNGDIKVTAGGLLNNDRTLIMTGDLEIEPGGFIEGDGVHEIEGDFINHGLAYLRFAVFIMQGTTPSAFINSQEELELGYFIINKTASEVSLEDSLYINRELIFAQGTLDLNGQVMRLDKQASITDETAASYIFDSDNTGTGQVTYTKRVNAQSGAPLGNLGLTVSSAEDLGEVTVIRRHYNTVATKPIINRSYEVSYVNTTGTADLSFTYFDHEVGSVDENELALFTLDNGTLSEQSFTSFDAVTNVMTYTGSEINTEFVFAEGIGLLTWTGALSSDWADPQNWTPQLLPSKTIDVLIPDVNTHDPEIGATTDAECKSLTIEANALLTCNNSLRIEGAENDGITIAGQLDHLTGLLELSNIGGDGISISSTGGLYNSGQIENDTDGNVTGNYLVNAGIVENEGTITINQAGGSALANQGTGTFLNSGFFTVGNDFAADIAGGTAIQNEGNYTNQPSGYILLQNVETGIDNSGTFLNQDDLLFQSISSSAIQDEGTFTNTGTMAGNAININLASDLGGTLVPGFSPGRMTFESSLRFVAGATAVMDVSGTGSDEADRIQVAGVVNLNNLNLQIIINYTPTDGDRIDLITGSVIAGSLASADLPDGWVLLTGPSLAIRYDASLLPVEWASFTVTPEGKDVFLYWETSSETNNEGFDIEYSTDGERWTFVAFVPGKGNTQQAQGYTFMHTEPSTGHNYYRLRQVDYDGTFSYSPIRYVDLDLDTPKIQVFPNPTQDYVQVRFPNTYERATLIIRDVSGRALFQQQYASTTASSPIHVQDWPASTYLLYLTMDGQSQVQKLVVTK